MNYHLVVTRAFGPYAKGDVISDGIVMAQVLADERAHNVVRVASPTQGG